MHTQGTMYMSIDVLSLSLDPKQIQQFLAHPLILAEEATLAEER